MPAISVFDNVTREDPRSLVPMSDNTQERTRAELDRIKDSIRAHGLVGPIVGRPSDRSIAGGHGRLEAVIELLDEGYTLEDGIPVVWRECDDAELLALNMALNNATGQPSFQKIAVAIQKIETMGRPELLVNGATGFTPLQITDLQALAILPAGQHTAPTTQTRQDAGEDADDYDEHDFDESLADRMAETKPLMLDLTPEQWSVVNAATKATGYNDEAEALVAVCAYYVEAGRDAD